MSKNSSKKIVKFCAYSHIYKIALKSIYERKLPGEVKHGAIITLLGIFCPFFWIALFSGASNSVKIFHAAHSGVVIMIGITIMILGVIKASKRGKNGR